MDSLPLLRLMQLVSPSLPIGGFTYSQGLETAVDLGWLKSEADTADWLQGVMQDGLVYLELPILARLQQAFADQNADSVQHWCDLLLAARETRELREEERQRGRALASLLVDLGVSGADYHRAALASGQTAGFALAAHAWQIPPLTAALGFAWSWLENQIAAAIKLVPLGQTAGQRLQMQLAGAMPELVEQALRVEDAEIGAGLPALAIASSRHETQYTRLFRS